ncbi:MAG: (deoxy)nucleoside triphosphate pyrophosphohydrolase [Candidatus Omnitrophica bacterium]|nr:(deoxy)nucleoside triphosphate pyrophosphohydrolase [Candidatus Omnitrophota bacterium]
MKRHLTVVAACITDGEQVLICQRKEDDAFGLLWEFPGGKVEDGEDLASAIIREIEEELGVTVSVGRELGIFEDENETLKITVHLLENKIILGTPQTRDCNAIRWVGIGKLDSFDLAPVDRKITRFLQGNTR